MALLLPTTAAVPIKIFLFPATPCPIPFKRTRIFTVNPRLSISASLQQSLSASAARTVAPSRAGWVVVMEKPPVAGGSKMEIVDYYVQTLARVLGSEKAAQACIYDAAWENQFGFCCDIDEGSSKQLSIMPGVLSVSPDKDPESTKKDYSCSKKLGDLQSNVDADGISSRFARLGAKSEYWIVRMERPGVEVVTKAQMVDHYTRILMKVMGNEKDAQMSIYNISWEKDFGFCCRIDEDCARELADVPGVLSVRTDVNFESDNKDYRGDDMSGSLESSQTPEVKTKRLFVTGLSFYTSEKTLRAAFEGFGELVEVKIIMDKISKRSKGYAFIEYTTEEAGGAALKEMNGKIINGWMIVVDVAKTNPPKVSRGRPRTLGSS